MTTLVALDDSATIDLTWVTSVSYHAASDTITFHCPQAPDLCVGLSNREFGFGALVGILKPIEAARLCFFWTQYSAAVQCA